MIPRRSHRLDAARLTVAAGQKSLLAELATIRGARTELARLEAERSARADLSARERALRDEVAVLEANQKTWLDLHSRRDTLVGSLATLADVIGNLEAAIAAKMSDGTSLELLLAHQGALGDANDLQDRYIAEVAGIDAQIADIEPRADCGGDLRIELRVEADALRKVNRTGRSAAAFLAREAEARRAALPIRERFRIDHGINQRWVAGELMARAREVAPATAAPITQPQGAPDA